MHLLQHAKRASLIMMVENKRTIINSVVTVLKLIPPPCIINVDKWWSVRNVINPAIIIFGPYALFLKVVPYCNVAVCVFLYFAIVIGNAGFIKRYIDWMETENNLSIDLGRTENNLSIEIAEKIMKEEQKLD